MLENHIDHTVVLLFAIVGAVHTLVLFSRVLRIFAHEVHEELQEWRKFFRDVR
jgi:hypothetical protein